MALGSAVVSIPPQSFLPYDVPACRGLAPFTKRVKYKNDARSLLGNLK
jgi:hypothetical protein